MQHVRAKQTERASTRGRQVGRSRFAAGRKGASYVGKERKKRREEFAGASICAKKGEGVHAGRRRRSAANRASARARGFRGSLCVLVGRMCCWWEARHSNHAQARSILKECDGDRCYNQLPAALWVAQRCSPPGAAEPGGLGGGTIYGTAGARLAPPRPTSAPPFSARGRPRRAGGWQKRRGSAAPGSSGPAWAAGSQRRRPWWRCS